MFFKREVQNFSGYLQQFSNACKAIIMTQLTDDSMGHTNDVKTMSWDFSPRIKHQSNGYCSTLFTGKTGRNISPFCRTFNLPTICQNAPSEERYKSYYNRGNIWENIILYMNINTHRTNSSRVIFEPLSISSFSM